MNRVSPGGSTRYRRTSRNRAGLTPHRNLLEHSIAEYAEWIEFTLAGTRED